MVGSDSFEEDRLTLSRATPVGGTFCRLVSKAIKAEGPQYEDPRSVTGLLLFFFGLGHMQVRIRSVISGFSESIRQVFFLFFFREGFPPAVELPTARKLFPTEDVVFVDSGICLRAGVDLSVGAE